MKKILYALLPLFLSACASANITSVKNPQFIDRQYSCVIVLSVDTNLETRKLFEEMVVDALKTSSARILKSIDVLPPTMEPTKENVKQAVLKEKCESLLTVTYSGGNRSTTYMKDGTPLVSSNFQTQAILWDVATQQRAWVGGGGVSHLTVIPVGTGIDTMLRKAAVEISDKLLADKMIASNAMP